MDLISTLSIAVGLAMDAFAVCLTNGMCVRHLRFGYALKLALCFGFFQALMPTLGWLLGVNFRDQIAAIDHWVAFVLLSFIGGKMLLDGIRSAKSEEEEVCYPEAGLKTMLLLGVATSIDALAVGVTFAFVGETKFFSLLPHVGAIGLVTLAICLAGMYMGKRFGLFLKNKSEMFGGVVLIVIGGKILLEHTLFA